MTQASTMMGTRPRPGWISWEERRRERDPNWVSSEESPYYNAPASLRTGGNPVYGDPAVSHYNNPDLPAGFDPAGGHPSFYDNSYATLYDLGMTYEQAMESMTPEEQRLVFGAELGGRVPGQGAYHHVAGWAPPGAEMSQAERSWWANNAMPTTALGWWQARPASPAAATTRWRVPGTAAAASGAAAGGTTPSPGYDPRALLGRSAGLDGQYRRTVQRASVSQPRYDATALSGGASRGATGGAAARSGSSSTGLGGQYRRTVQRASVSQPRYDATALSGGASRGATSRPYAASAQGGQQTLATPRQVERNPVSAQGGQQTLATPWQVERMNRLGQTPEFDSEALGLALEESQAPLATALENMSSSLSARLSQPASQNRWPVDDPAWRLMAGRLMAGPMVTGYGPSTWGTGFMG